jgi:hypothetical protein
MLGVSFFNLNVNGLYTREDLLASAGIAVIIPFFRKIGSVWIRHSKLDTPDAAQYQLNSLRLQFMVLANGCAIE